MSLTEGVKGKKGYQEGLDYSTVLKKSQALPSWICPTKTDHKRSSFSPRNKPLIMFLSWSVLSNKLDVEHGKYNNKNRVFD